MTKLRRLVSISILVVSLVGAAVAGETQGPPVPPPEHGRDGSGIQASTPAQPAEDSSVDIVAEAAIFATWLALSIL